MIDLDTADAGRFSLRQMFLAVTTTGVAFGVMVSELPAAVKTSALFVPAFWAGVIVYIAGIAITKRPWRFAPTAGDLIMSLGIGVAFIAALAGCVSAFYAVVSVVFSFFG